MKIIKIYSGFFFKDFYFKHNEEKLGRLSIGDLIIFKSGQNTYRGEVKNFFKDGTSKKNDEDFTFIRKCTEEDLTEIEELKQKESEFLKFFGENYNQFKIELETNTCELSFDNKMLLFSFTSESRVDFRELVKFLAGKYRRRIQLKHLGTRDKASFFGGYGVCGRELCCSKFLKEIPAVPIHAPKVQDLMYKDMENLLGVCGKLKCCLNYEIQQYQDIKKNLPKIGTSIFMDDKKGIIIGLDIFSQKIKVKYPDSAKIYDLDEIKDFIREPIKNNYENNISKNTNKNFKKTFDKKFEKKPFKNKPFIKKETDKKNEKKSVEIEKNKTKKD